MDLSSTYILMCTKAHEIQKSWTPMEMDLVYVPKTWKIPLYKSRFVKGKHVITSKGLVDCNTKVVKKGIYFIGQRVAGGYESTYHLGPSRCPSSIHEAVIWALGSEEYPIWDKSWIWLPRQDQLQTLTENIPQSEKFFVWMRMRKWSEPCYNKNVSSWEKLWLMYTMKKMFNKIWDKYRWVVA